LQEPSLANERASWFDNGHRLEFRSAREYESFDIHIGDRRIIV